ncbi:cytochrome c oxidase assembly protein [Lentibacillus sp. N15]|uniref:cytochrome c oxidase assembly protein n=1 Tax=Lentibacillus songyuanensis TaxID=3136161 RepID=UPI0031BAF97E
MDFELLLLEGTWNISLLFSLLGIAFIYAWMLRRFATINVHRKQAFLFYGALIILYMITGSPIASIGHLSFSLHMIQMSLLYFIIPPMLMLGIPEQLIKSIRIPSWNSRYLSSIGLIGFASMFFMYHIPFMLQTFSQFPFLHQVYFILLLFFSFCMWFPITSPDPAHRYPKKQMKRYAFWSGLLIMPACILFIIIALFQEVENPFVTNISSNLCFPSQTNSFHILPFPFNTKYDQFTAGILMMGMHKTGLIFALRHSEPQDGDAS